MVFFSVVFFGVFWIGVLVLGIAMIAAILRTLFHSEKVV